MIVIIQCLLVILFAFGTTILSEQSGLVLLAPGLVILGLVPLIDFFLVKYHWSFLNWGNHSAKKYAILPHYLYVILHFISLYVFVRSVPGDPGLTIFFKVLASSMFNGGACIIHGHELGHRKNKFDKFLGTLCYASFGYGHFVLEHFQGHHKNAATDADPTSARRGESFWSFLPRSSWGQICSALKLEKNNFKQNKWSWEDSIFVGGFVTLILLGLSFLISGLSGLGFFLMHILVTVLIMETGNYIQHYGLARQYQGTRFEKFKENHAWSVNAPLSNIILFNMPFHSHHHLQIKDTYVDLKNQENSPQAPVSYFILMGLALIPPLWYKIIHPILDKYEEKPSQKLEKLSI